MVLGSSTAVGSSSKLGPLLPSRGKRFSGSTAVALKTFQITRTYKKRPKTTLHVLDEDCFLIVPPREAIPLRACFRGQVKNVFSNIFRGSVFRDSLASSRYAPHKHGTCGY